VRLLRSPGRRPGLAALGTHRAMEGGMPSMPLVRVLHPQCRAVPPSSAPALRWAVLGHSGMEGRFPLPP